jgi:hypothetical protein
MKSLLSIVVASATCCFAFNTAVSAKDLPPGQVDFGTFSPPKEGGEFVEVNIPPSLIWLAARLVEKDEPEAAQLLTGLKLVRVNVIGLSDDNRAEIQSRAKKVRQDLTGKGWERIVAAQQKNQDVSVYLKMSDSSTVQGLVAVVMDDKDHAVFVNVVGDIKPEQIALLGDKLHIDPLKKLGQSGEKPSKKHKAKDAEKLED